MQGNQGTFTDPIMTLCLVVKDANVAMQQYSHCVNVKNSISCITSCIKPECSPHVTLPYVFIIASHWVCLLIIQMTQTSRSLKYPLILTGISRFKPASQFVVRYQNAVKFYTEHGGSDFEQICKLVSNKEISNIF
jgi:hypothetical protein